MCVGGQSRQLVKIIPLDLLGQLGERNMRQNLEFDGKTFFLYSLQFEFTDNDC